jgi:hypothetical protein
MEKLRVNLEHCYGIKKLAQDFVFSDFRTFLIYAPNGVMKTSFAKTLKTIASKKGSPCDQMDDSLVPTFDFLIDDSQDQIEPEDICVIEPYNEKVFESEDKILTLLANKESREEYVAIYKEIEASKKATLSSLKKISGSSNYEAEITESFSHLNKRNIFDIFDCVLDQVKSSEESFDFNYNHVFDSKGKVKEFLRENITLLQEYTEKYEQLIDESEFFGKSTENVFGTTEAKNLNSSLQGDEYFVAGHKLLLKKHGEIEKREDFSKILDEEIESIFNDEKLKELFAKIDKALDANAELKNFKKVIEKNRNKTILTRLVDYETFRQDVWFSFLKQIETGLETLIELYREKKPELEIIIEKAANDKPRWESAINEFESRFINMPFTIEIDNVADAVLNETAPVIYFKFKGMAVERKQMIENILSQGEKRAFYLLNVIFEIKSRQLQNKKTLFIIDDIADSFDYKNKYAIVEYLNDLSKDKNFYSIVLTHNFDFFRTLQSRILPEKFKRSHSFIAEKLEDKIQLVEAGSRNVTDPFATWRSGVNTNEKHLIACIPFVRNLVDFKDGKTNDYKLLTHILHLKDENKEDNIKATTDIFVCDLEPVFKSVLKNIEFEFENPDTRRVIDMIDFEIEAVKNQPNTDSVVLEDKVILAIGIRLKAEEYILSKITDKSTISNCQTGVLIGRYKSEFATEAEHEDALKILESVNIMTPENIHLNSFMYEPILDMGIDELKSLHSVVSALLT